MTTKSIKQDIWSILGCGLLESVVIFVPIQLFLIICEVFGFILWSIIVLLISNNSCLISTLNYILIYLLEHIMRFIPFHISDFLLQLVICFGIVNTIPIMLMGVFIIYADLDDYGSE